MEVTHWMTTITHMLQLALQYLTPTRPLGEFFMPWVHELSITALAAAVVTLGVVMLLELRALAALRRDVDSHLARVFEQLDLIRFDHVQLLEAHARHSAGISVAAPLAARAEAGTPRGSTSVNNSNPAAATTAALAAGEARLLASLAEARARRTDTTRSAASKPAAVAR